MEWLWKEDGFPHKWWIYLWFEDNWSLYSNCQACWRSIRYIHSLKHGNFRDIIEVWSECARKLAEPYKEIIQINEKRSNWVRKKHSWKINRNGNYISETRIQNWFKFKILVFSNNWYWKANYKKQLSVDPIWCDREFSSIEEAKRFILELLSVIIFPNE